MEVDEEGSDEEGDLDPLTCIKSVTFDITDKQQTFKLTQVWALLSIKI